MLRDFSAERMGQSFMEGLKQNVSKEHKAKIIDQMIKLGEIFSKVPEFHQGDKLAVDWLPEAGTVIMINGKKNHGYLARSFVLQRFTETMAG